MFQVIDKSFGFDTAVEEAQRAINAAHVEVESVENGVGIVKLMGRYSGNYLEQCIVYFSYSIFCRVFSSYPNSSDIFRIHCYVCYAGKSRCGKTSSNEI